MLIFHYTCSKSHIYKLIYAHISLYELLYAYIRLYMERLKRSLGEFSASRGQVWGSLSKSAPGGTFPDKFRINSG